VKVEILAYESKLLFEFCLNVFEFFECTRSRFPHTWRKFSGEQLDLDGGAGTTG